MSLGSIRVGGFGWTNEFGLTLPLLMRDNRFDLRGERDSKWKIIIKIYKNDYLNKIDSTF